MLLGAALAELLRLLGGAAWLDGASRWCMILGGVGAIITAPLGWAFAVEHGHSRLLEIHRWLGTAAGAGALVSAAVRLPAVPPHLNDVSEDRIAFATTSPLPKAFVTPSSTISATAKDLYRTAEGSAMALTTFEKLGYSPDR